MPEIKEEGLYLFGTVTAQDVTTKGTGRTIMVATPRKVFKFWVRNEDLGKYPIGKQQLILMQGNDAGDAGFPVK